MPASASPRILVLGAGVAGLAAAVRLADRGHPVTVLETAKRLGGRASSFDDRTTGRELDNCQHVLTRACTHLLSLYRRLGVDQHIAWHDTLHFADAAGRVASLRRDRLPAPLHLARAWLSFPLLPLRTRLAIARGMAAALRVRDRDLPALDAISFADWLARRRQPADAIDRYWRVVIVSACNESLDRVSARYALQVFREGFLQTADAYQMGVPRVPLRRLYDPAADVVEAAGGAVRQAAGVAQLHYDGGTRGEGGRVTAVELTTGEVIEADAVIAALPFDRLDRIVPDALHAADPRLQRLDQLEHSPIVGIHLTLAHPDGRPVLNLPHLALLDSPLHWIFNKGPADAPKNALPEDQPSPQKRGGGSERQPTQAENAYSSTLPNLASSGSAGTPASPHSNHASVGKPLAAHEKTRLASANDPTPAGSAPEEKEEGGQLLHGVISAAHDLTDQTGDAIVTLAMNELHRILPRAHDARLIAGRAIKEKRATFAIRPGTDAVRPATIGPTANLFLAGDWTATGWPATMEGATRSGHTAADAAARLCYR